MNSQIKGEAQEKNPRERKGTRWRSEMERGKKRLQEGKNSINNSFRFAFSAVSSVVIFI